MGRKAAVLKKKSKSKFGYVLLLLFSIYFAYIFAEQQNLIFNKNLEMKNIQTKVLEEKTTNEDLREQEEIISNEEYIEKIAREKLGMVKPGEKVFVDVNK